MAAVDAQHRLQPSLLDRLTDDHRGDHIDTERVMSKAQLRQAVLRDLGVLFNAIQPLGRDLDGHPVLGNSVLNFGLPSLSGRLASELDVSLLETALCQAIARFEPRILADTLQVRALEANSLLDTHNVIEFEIHGQLWSQPVPLEILLRTRLNLEAGQVEVSDATSMPPSSARTGRHTL